MMDGSLVDGGAGRRDAGRAVRTAARSGAHDTVTTGLAPGFVQANIVILPKAWAADFLLYCQRNSEACPVIAVAAAGDWTLPELGDDIDIRSDVPRYRVFRDGVCTDEPSDISELWRDDLVTFALGCSYSFEEALLQAGLRLQHIANNTKVPIYRTGIATAPAGAFSGPMIVSMRPFAPREAIRAIQVTSRFPRVHGAPVHFGDPAMIGIPDIRTPWSGVEPEIRPGEVPLFWACGVTPQLAIEAAKPPFCITHKAGHMLVTDRLNAEFASF